MSPVRGDRHNADKAPIHLVAPSVMVAIAEAAGYGADVYGARNWERGHAYSITYSSLMRHLLAWWSGEDDDPKSGLPHSYHIAWNAQALIETERRITDETLSDELDDRPIYEEQL